MAIRQVARSGQFDLILTSPVAFASDRVDITQRILEWLEDDFNSQSSDDLSGRPAMNPIDLGSLAERFELSLTGDRGHVVSGLATLKYATPDDLAFLANPSYASQLADCRAGAVILGAEHARRFTGNCLISKEPYVDWARVSGFLNPPPAATAGIHPSAVIASDAAIADSASIAPRSASDRAAASASA